MRKESKLSNLIIITGRSYYDEYYKNEQDQHHHDKGNRT